MVAYIGDTSFDKDFLHCFAQRYFRFAIEFMYRDEIIQTTLEFPFQILNKQSKHSNREQEVVRTQLTLIWRIRA